MRDLEIRDLVVRLPGVSREQAGVIAAAVARRLADTITEWSDTNVPALATMVVHVRPGSSADDIVRQVTDAIAGALR